MSGARTASEREGRLHAVARHRAVVDEVYAVRLHQVAPEEGDVSAEGGQRDVISVAPCAQIYLFALSQLVVHFEDDVAFDHNK